MGLRLVPAQRDPQVAPGMPVIQRPPRAIGAAGEQGQAGEPEDDAQPGAAALGRQPAPAGGIEPALQRRAGFPVHDEHRGGERMALPDGPVEDIGQLVHR